MAREWTVSDDDKIISMRDSGCDWATVAKKMRATVSQVRNRYYLHKKSPKKDTNKNSQQLHIKRLERKVEQLQSALDIARKPRVPFSPKASKSKSGDYIRIAIPDTHGSKVDRKALGALLADIEMLSPREVVLLGDHIDCGGFLATHHTLGYVAESAYTFEEDVSHCNQFLDDLQSRCKGADFHYLEGNHESRIEKWIVTQTLANNRDASYLRRQFSPEAVLFLEKRGIKYYERSKFHGDVPVPGTIRLGKCHFVHGSRTGTHSAMAMLRDFGGNVVYGHVHSMDSASLRTVHHGTIGAWTPGCLCELQPTYMHTQITRWNHGYALQFCRENGDFLHINVPIINGESYLAPLTKAIGA